MGCMLVWGSRTPSRKRSPNVWHPPVVTDNIPCTQDSVSGFWLNSASRISHASSHQNVQGSHLSQSNCSARASKLKRTCYPLLVHFRGLRKVLEGKDTRALPGFSRHELTTPCRIVYCACGRRWTRACVWKERNRQHCKVHHACRGFMMCRAA